MSNQTLTTAEVRDVFVGTGGDEGHVAFDKWLREGYVERISEREKETTYGASLAVMHLLEAQKAFHPQRDRGGWIMIQQMVSAITGRELRRELPITRWAYDPELGRIDATHHRLKDLKEED